MSAVRRFIPYLLVLVVTIFWIRCWLSGCSKTSTTKAQLIVQSHLIGDWLDMSNPPDTKKCDPTANPKYRTGVFFQFGTRIASADGAPAYYYKEIRIYPTGATSPDVYTDWVWVNIISDDAGWLDPPMSPDDAFALFPNNHPNVTGGTATCPVTLDAASGCNRNRCIRSDMEKVGAIMTYWQGQKGWSVAAKQELGLCTGNTFRFTLNDPFRVDVYKPADPVNDTTMGTPYRSYASAKVDSIVVALTPSGPDRGEMQLPPWPYP